MGLNDIENAPGSSENLPIPLPPALSGSGINRMSHKRSHNEPTSGGRRREVMPAEDNFILNPFVDFERRLEKEEILVNRKNDWDVRNRRQVNTENYRWEVPITQDMITIFNRYGVLPSDAQVSVLVLRLDKIANTIDGDIDSHENVRESTITIELNTSAETVEVDLKGRTWGRHITAPPGEPDDWDQRHDWNVGLRKRDTRVNFGGLFGKGRFKEGENAYLVNMWSDLNSLFWRDEKLNGNVDSNYNPLTFSKPSSADLEEDRSYSF